MSYNDDLIRQLTVELSEETGTDVCDITKDKMLDMLLEKEAHLPGGFFQYEAEKDSGQHFRFVSKSLMILLGYKSVDDFKASCNNSFIDFVYEEDRERVQSEIYSQINYANEDYCFYRVRKADGSLIWIFDRGRIVEDINGRKWFFVVVTNADHFIRQQLQLRAEHAQLRIISSLPGMITYEFMPDEDRLILHINHVSGDKETREITSFRKNLDNIKWLSSKSLIPLKRSLDKVIDYPSSGALEICINKNNRELWYRISFACVENVYGNGSVIAGEAFCIDEYLKNAEVWRLKALKDSLTGLYNHDHLINQMEKMLSDGTGGCLIMVDVDNFKSINDVFGHIEGDHVLTKVAAVLKRCFRTGDIEARYGGDEFAVLLPTLIDRDLAKRKITSMKEKLSEIKTPDGKPVSFSIGVSVIGVNEESDAESFIKSADSALYEAKAAGKNTIRFDV